MGRRFDEFCQNTTCHGWGHLSNSKSKTAKTIWAIVMIFALFSLTQQLVTMFGNYLDKDQRWTTTVYERQDLTGKKDLEVPTITVCNFNRVRKSLADEYGFTEEEISGYFQTYFTAKYPISQYSTMLENIGSLAHRLEVSNLTIENLRDDFSHKCQNMLIVVSVGRAAFSGYLTCEGVLQYENINVSTVAIDTPELGRCMQINIQVQQAGKAPGMGSSISLILDTEEEEYLEQTDSNFFDQGFIFQISYEGKMDFGQWLTVQGGQHAWVSIQQHKTTVNRKDVFPLYEPDCLYEENAKLNVFRDADYSMALCQQDCEWKMLANFCGCVLSFGNEMKYPTCPPAQVPKCFEHFAKNEESISEDIKKCKDDCKPPCESKDVVSSISTTKFPSKAQAGRLAKDMNVTVETLNSRYCAIDIYYKTFAVRIVELRERSTLDDLISNIGGQLGVWLGISVITIGHGILSVILAICSPKNEIEPQQQKS